MAQIIVTGISKEKVLEKIVFNVEIDICSILKDVEKEAILDGIRDVLETTIEDLNLKLLETIQTVDNDFFKIDMP